jgi:adenosylcobinamide kinase/adenosylcobinamide-phosphate guanylyltransferase
MSGMESGRLLILGGARSGKTSFALQAAGESGGDAVTFIATAGRGDPDFDARIARHVAQRPAAWRTVEAGTDLAAAIASAPEDTVVLVDCLTIWVARALDAELALQTAWNDAERVLALRRRPVIMVSNEVGMSVHPSYASGMRFRDELGWVNQRAAAFADRVVLVIAGLPLPLKPCRA